MGASVLPVVVLLPSAVVEGDGAVVVAALVASSQKGAESAVETVVAVGREDHSTLRSIPLQIIELVRIERDTVEINNGYVD